MNSKNEHGTEAGRPVYAKAIRLRQGYGGQAPGRQVNTRTYMGTGRVALHLGLVFKIKDKSRTR